MSVESLRRLFNETYGTNYKTTAFHYHTDKMGLKKVDQHNYTKEEDEFLATYSSLLTREQLTSFFNKKFGTHIKKNTIEMRCHLKGYKGMADGQFKKGSTPWEKSKGGKEEYLKKLRAAENKGCFRKGQKPHNEKEIGTESTKTRPDNKNGSSVYIKTKTGWKLKQVVIWEKHFDAVLPGELVIFADGDKTNFDISNLRKVSNRTFVRLHSNGWLYSGDPELVDTAIIYSELANILNEPRKE